MKLSIIILNFKSWKDTETNLTTLFKHLPKGDLEVIVVDNFSEQEKPEASFIKKWVDTGKVTYLPQQKNHGFGEGNNAGFRNAKGKYLLILNPDIKVTEGIIDDMLKYMEEHPTVGILGPKLLYPDNQIQDSYRNFPRFLDQIIKRTKFLRKRKFLRRRISEYLLWNKDPNITEPVDWVVGGFMLIRRTAYQEVGGFDPRYFLFMEDVDLCRRMWHKGWQVVYYAEKHAIHNDERLSQGGIMALFKKKTLRIHLMSAIKYFWKWKGKPLPR